MTIQNQATIPSELILRVSEETQCLMDMRREAKECGDLPDIPDEQDEIIQLYQNGITRIGKAWDLQTEAATAREQLRNTTSEKNEADTWSLTEAQILSILWGLFETAVQLDDKEDRQGIYKLAQEIMDFHGLDLRINPSR